MKTYRSKNQVVAGWLFIGIGLVFLPGYLMDGMEPAFRVLWGLFLAYLLLVGIRFTRAGIEASERGVHVANVFSSFDLRWDEIAGFRVGQWKLLPSVCRIELRDGGARVAFGIQERTNFPSGSAERMARELNAELEARSGSLAN
jgi:hypothetical protein